MHCSILGLELEAYDWLKDVYDDVMQVEDIVGEEKGYEGYQVTMDTPVDKNLEWKDAKLKKAHSRATPIGLIV